MPAFVYYSDELLQPITADQPGGADLRYDPVFTEIAEARRADEDLNEGEWQREGGRKIAEWGRVADLCTNAIRQRSKDLRIAGYLTEAALWLDGFSGLRDCLRLTIELLRRFWDKGLFPAIDDGDLDYRASAFVWLNDRMPELVGHVPLTARTGGENFGYTRYLQAQRVGSEAAIASAGGEKRETIQGLIRQGWITLDQFDTALKASDREALKAIFEPFEEADQALRDLEKLSDELFGASAPTFSTAKETMSAIRRILAPVMKQKQEKTAETAVGQPPSNAIVATASNSPVMSVFQGPAAAAAANGKGWDEAETLIRAGNVDQGLAQMASLASQEMVDRDRFLRKLMLSDVCLRNGRDRLARTLLEELNQKIDEFKLDRWESSGLVGAVWSRLYRLYRKSGESSDQERAVQLYNRLCHLDPWQAYLTCED